MPAITTTTTALPPATYTPSPTSLPTSLPPCCCSTSHHFTSMGNLHKMQRWPGFILCIGRTPKKVCYARALARVARFPSLSLSLCVSVCVHGYFLFCINAPQASLSLSPARLSSIAGPNVFCSSCLPLSLLSAASYSGATAAAADVNLLKKFRFLAFFCILAVGRSLYGAGGNRFHFMLSIEFKLFGK